MADRSQGSSNPRIGLALRGSAASSFTGSQQGKPMEVDDDTTTEGGFVQRWSSPAKPPPPDLPVSLAISSVAEKMGDLTADLWKLPHRELVSPEALAGAGPPPATPADVPMTDPEELVLAKQLAQTEALLEYEKTSRIHAEQVLQAYMGDQAAEAAPPHQLPADAPRAAIDEMRDSPKDLNPLERVDAEFKLLVQALRDGISLQDFDYDREVQHIASDTRWELVDPPLCK